MTEGKRESVGVHRIAPGISFDPTLEAYVVTTLADARAVLMSHDARFIGNAPAFAVQGGDPLQATLARGNALSRLWMWVSDPEEHGRVRKAAGSALAVANVKARRPAVRAQAEALLAALSAGSAPVDLVSGFVQPLLRRLIPDLLGVAPQALPQLQAAIETNPFKMAIGTRLEPRHCFAVAVIANIVCKAWEAPLPEEATIGRALLEAVANGAMSRDEALAQATLLLLGNAYTTPEVLSGLIARLSREPCLWSAARDKRIAVAALVEEGIRLTGPDHLVVLRRTAADISCPSGTIPADSAVALPLNQINRDPAAFDDADAFEPGRAGPRHISFGLGAHTCPGIHLARAALSEALEALLERLAVWPADVEVLRTASGLGGTRITAILLPAGALQCA